MYLYRQSDSSGTALAPVETEECHHLEHFPCLFSLVAC